MDSDTKASELDPSDMEERDFGSARAECSGGGFASKERFPFGRFQSEL